MNHKHTNKYESDSSGDSSSESSSSSKSYKKKSSKKRRRSSQSSEGSFKKPKKYSDSESEDERQRKKSKVDNEKHRKHTEKSHTHHSDYKHREKCRDYKEEQKRDKYEDRRENHRRNDSNERDRGRQSHHHKRRERESSSQSREDRNRSLNDRRRDRPWNRRRRSRSKSFDHSSAKWGKNEGSQSKSDKKNKGKEAPNFGLSGKLTEETNTYKGVVIKYSEPPEARKPRRRWRLYPFKGEKSLQTLYIHRQSAYLIGRDRKIADLPVDHPSCSKQHAALQYRLVQFTRDDGSVGKRVRPYIIDLESANGTFVNNKKIDPKKFVELLERDVVKFGFSSREYVLLHENSKDEALDDDVKVEDDEADFKVKKEEA